MDAAQTLKKTALFLAAALTFAAPSYAQLQVNGGAGPASVVLSQGSPARNALMSGMR